MAQPPLPPRPKAASMFMAVPVVFGGLLLLAVISLLVISNFQGCIYGDPMIVEFETSCPEEASTVVAERVHMMGLIEQIETADIQVEANRVILTATFPGYSEVENETIPATLAATGQLELRANREVLMTRDDIEGSELDQDESGMPIAVLTLSEESAGRIQAHIDSDPDGSTHFYLDDEFLVSRTNTRSLDGRTIRVLIDHGDTESRMRKIADLNVLLNTRVLPCPMSVLDIRKAE